MDALHQRYGYGRGDVVYFGLMAEAKGPFGPKGKYHSEHLDFAERMGVPGIETAPPKGRRRRKR
jgi:hypothetical protein